MKISIWKKIQLFFWMKFTVRKAMKKMDKEERESK